MLIFTKDDNDMITILYTNYKSQSDHLKIYSFNITNEISIICS